MLVNINEEQIEIKLEYNLCKSIHVHFIYMCTYRYCSDPTNCQSRQDKVISRCWDWKLHALYIILILYYINLYYIISYYIKGKTRKSIIWLFNIGPILWKRHVQSRGILCTCIISISNCYSFYKSRIFYIFRNKRLDFTFIYLFFFIDFSWIW
jgi:hypothetical protein